MATTRFVDARPPENRGNRNCHDSVAITRYCGDAKNHQCYIQVTIGGHYASFNPSEAAAFCEKIMQAVAKPMDYDF